MLLLILLIDNAHGLFRATHLYNPTRHSDIEAFHTSFILISGRVIKLLNHNCASTFLCNNITEGFTFFRYNRDTKFERGTKHWQKEWQVSIKKVVLPAEYVKILVRWQRSKFTMDVMQW